ncbi:restriction endonuclease subunit S [Limosilactobacillus reuteri]|uniref:restriction endonuclease subunit S n=1 Tax=Limosilactobacillus reuteri TaxID=1598 RepID=UPI003F9889F9
MYFSVLSIIFIKVRINVKWEQRKLGEISTSFSGGTPSVKNKSYYGGKIPFIRSAEIHKDKTELFITENGLKNSSAKLIKKGTLLYALYGATSGEVDVSNIDGAINQAIMAIFLQKDNVSFIKYYLEKNKYKIIAKYLQGGQGNLSASIIKSVHINLPFTEEQLKISNLIT